MKFFIIICFFLVQLFANKHFEPLPENIEFDKQKALLGKKLYFDPILSKDNTISCATCHNLELGGVDNLQYSYGIQGQVGKINTPTVFNAVYNFRQMWDGRANNLSHQVQFPILNPLEMGNDFTNLIENLQRDTYYKKTFYTLYKDGITKETISDALQEFQKTLVTPSKFDEYLRGKENALNDNQKKGFELFQTKGCVSCHNGVNIGGSLFARFGLFYDRLTQKVFDDFEIDDPSIYNPDFGFYNVTKNSLDKFYFKVPTLRNIELTAPYLHNGKIRTLKEAIKLIAESQLGLELTKEEIFYIEAFLKSLTGKVEIIQ